MPAFVLFHEAVGNIGKADIDLNGHTFKAMLTNTAPNQGTGSVKTDITEIAQGSGYTTGGVTLTNVTFAETGAGTGVWRFDCDDIAFTASGGAIAAHQYLVVYSDTHASKALLGYSDWGSSSTIASGVTRTWTTASGLFDMS